MVLVRERTIPAVRQSLFGEVSAKLLWIEGVAWSARRIPKAVISVFLTGAASSSSIVLVRLSGPRSRPATSQKIW
jgi:hypothetical protein